jgi:hypothetical protein
MKTRNSIKSEHIGVVLEPIKVRIGPLGFHGYASEFLLAAKAFKSPNKFSPVPYFLYCKSIELALKAYLLTKGVPLKKLKKRLGHNLIKILQKAKSKSLDDLIAVTPELERELRKANEYYDIKNKGFEYFDLKNAAMGYPDLPDLAMLKAFADQLVEKLEQTCIQAVNVSETSSK